MINPSGTVKTKSRRVRRENRRISPSGHMPGVFEAECRPHAIIVFEQYVYERWLAVLVGV